MQHNRGIEWRRVRPRPAAVWLLLAMAVCAPASGGPPAHLAARQPSYPSLEQVAAKADAASTSPIGRLKQKLTAVSDVFRRDAKQPTAVEHETEQAAPAGRDAGERSLSGAIGRKLNETFGRQEKPTAPLRRNANRTPELRTLRPRTPRPAAAPQVVTERTVPPVQPLRRKVARRSTLPPPIVYGSPDRLPTGGSRPRLQRIRANARSIDRQRGDGWPAFRNGPLQRRIEQAGGIVDTAALAGEADESVLESDGRRPRTIDVPMNDAALEGRINISSHNGRISLIVRDAPLAAVLDLIAQQQGLNIVTAGPALTPVSATLTNVDLDDALNSLLSVAGYTWVRQKEIIVVSPLLVESGLAPDVQGRTVRVFPLNFVSATDLQPVVAGLLSPVGQVFLTEALSTDKRRTRDQLVVEDLPGYLRRVEEYIAQVDQPPRQVLIEAHILRVDLSDETRHGVDFQYVAELAGAELSLRTQGFTNPGASPAFFLGVDGTDLDALVEAIQTTTDAKTLASPKVLVLNGQESRIQIGERFGYLVTTTTETSTLQNVDFLDVGVVLTVTPQISDDGQVLMTVKPEVSSGRINILTGLPEEETTEVDTTVMLPDGHGIVIGGLIQETDSNRQSKIPIVGDLWLVGKLFQRKTLLRERAEIVIALVPRIVPYGPDYDPVAETQFERATTRLFHGPLWKTDRPWEPVLPDAMLNPRELRVCRIPHAIPNLFAPTPNPCEYYFATWPELDAWLPPLMTMDEDDFEDAIYAEPIAPMPSYPYDD